MHAISEVRARRVQIALLAVAAVAFVLFRMPFLSVPLERDEGEYAYVADGLLAGEVPYRDAFDQKPPGVFAAYATAFSLFGRSVEGIHGFAFAWTALTAAALFMLVRRLLDGIAAALAALVFSVASVDPRLAAQAANTEIFLLLPIVAFAWLVASALERGGTARWLAAGVLAAVACAFKQVAATDALFFAGFAGVVLVRGPGGAAAAGRALAAVAVGAAALAGGVALWFAARGAFDPFFDSVVLHNLRYAGSQSLSGGLDRLGASLLHQAPSFGALWLLAALGLAGVGLRRGRDRAFFAGWLAASAAGVSIGFHFRPHYFVQCLPALSVLAAAPLAELVRRAAARPGATAGALASLAAVAVVIAIPALTNAPYLRAESPDAIARRIYGLNPFPEAVRIGEYIRRTSAPDDTIYVVGSEPEIFFYAERRSATRYIFFYPLTGPYPDAPERQREVVASVREHRPRYVVWVNLPTSLLLTEQTDPYVFEASTEILRAYRVELIARPNADLSGFEFVHGDAARHLAARLEDRISELPWVIVYRRLEPPG